VSYVIYDSTTTKIFLNGNPKSYTIYSHCSIRTAVDVGKMVMVTTGNNGELYHRPLRPTEALSLTLQKMDLTTTEALRCCGQVTKRARQLDSLTSPASDASSMLSRANANLAATLVLLRDAREKFDTVSDCEPSIERLYRGVTDMEEARQASKNNSNEKQPVTKGASAAYNKKNKHRIVLTEQDVYAAGDSMEILRDSFLFFNQRKSWRSAQAALSGLERLYQMGMDTMCLLINSHLKSAGQAVRPKRNVKKDALWVPPMDETAKQVSSLDTCIVFEFGCLTFCFMESFVAMFPIDSRSIGIRFAKS
jgi:hypothetical protein